MASIRAPLYEDKIVDFITEMAEVSEKKVTREVLLAEPSSETPGKPKNLSQKRHRQKGFCKKTSAKSTPKKQKNSQKQISEKHPKLCDFGCLQGQRNTIVKEI